MASAPSDTAWSVAIIRARYNPFGGAERFVQRALAALSEQSDRKLELTVIARRWQGDRHADKDQDQADMLPPGVRLQRLNPFYLGSVWRDASFAKAVQEHLARTPYRLVQSHERIPGVMIYRAGDGVHAEFLAQRRRVMSPVARLTMWLNPYHGWILRTERRMFEHPALRAVICNSTMVRDEIAARFRIEPSRLKLIRNGVDLERFAPPTTEQRQAARMRWGLESNEPVLAFVGSGFERKGLESVLVAMADRSAPPTLRLLVAGSDKQISHFRSRARRLGVARRVIYLGGIRDVVPVLHAADGFVLPTLYDPFPNGVLEALACGLPTITSTKSGAAEVIEHGKNGFVLDALDSTAIAGAMATMIRPDQLPALREAARASVAGMSSSQLGDELLALYREVAGSGAGRG